MKPLSAQTGDIRNSRLDLDFPVDPGFESKMQVISADTLFRMNHWLVIACNTRPGFEEERLRTKCGVEFVL